MIEYVVCGGLLMWVVYEKIKNTSEIVDDDLVVNFRFLNENQMLRIQGTQIPSFYKVDVPNYPTIKAKSGTSTFMYGLPTKFNEKTEVSISKSPSSHTKILLSGNINWEAELEKIRKPNAGLKSAATPGTTPANVKTVHLNADTLNVVVNNSELTDFEPASPEDLGFLDTNKSLIPNSAKKASATRQRKRSSKKLE